MLTFIQRGLPLLLAVLISIQAVAYRENTVIVDSISSSSLITQIKANKSPLILDVRTKKEYDLGHIPEAVNIDFKQLNQRINEIDNYKNSTVVVYCETGVRAKVAELILSQAGFKSILHLEGDMSGWRSSNLPTKVE